MDPAACRCRASLHWRFSRCTLARACCSSIPVCTSPGFARFSMRVQTFSSRAAVACTRVFADVAAAAAASRLRFRFC